MTNQEQILEVIEFFKGKKLIFKKEHYIKAEIRSIHGNIDPGGIRVILKLCDGCHWHISISKRYRSINWLCGSKPQADNWDLTLNGISFKKCIKEGLGCLTLYDMIQ